MLYPLPHPHVSAPPSEASISTGCILNDLIFAFAAAACAITSGRGMRDHSGQRRRARLNRIASAYPGGNCTVLFSLTTCPRGDQTYSTSDCASVVDGRSVTVPL